MPRSPNDLLHGTLDVLVLQTLTWGPMHGYGITTWIELHSGDELEIVDAALYKALHRLEAAAAVSATWGMSENNRKAKYYQLTPAGRRQLREETANWDRIALAIGRALKVT